jgi:hypothetical protein
MQKVRWIIFMIFITRAIVFSVTSNINVQFLVSDIDNGVFDGPMTIIYELYPTSNVVGKTPLWFEEHYQTVTQGSIMQKLGLKNPMNYHDFKTDELHLRLVFKESGESEPDDIVLPLISVPASIVSKFSTYAREIEFTEPWFKVNTLNYRVGIGVTQNLTDRLHVVGSANITTVNAVGAIHSPDGFNIHKLDYEKLLNLDDYSLSPYDYSRFYDANGALINTLPTVDVVYVTSSRNVGVGFIDATANIKETLHVSGNIKTDKGLFLGDNTSIYLEGKLLGGGLDVVASNQNWDIQTAEIERFMWDSHKAAIRAGRFSGDGVGYYQKIGDFSAAFGFDNTARGNYSFSVGYANIVNSEGHSSTIAGGESNEVLAPYSGILTGQDNHVLMSPGYSTIGGGLSNQLKSAFGSIAGGENNIIEADALHSNIGGGKDNKISGLFSSILGGYDNITYGNYSVALGLYSRIGKNDAVKHNKVFVFSDGSTGSTGVQSTTDQQFIVHAENGALFGLHDGIGSFTYGNRIELTGTTTYKIPGIDKHYPPLTVEWMGGRFDEEGQASSIVSNEDVKKHTIWTAGDVVALNPTDSGVKLGYIVGDGRFLTNLSSLWSSNSEEKTVYVTQKRIGIGGMNNGEYNGQNGLYTDEQHSLLYLKEVTDAGGGSAFPAVIRWESDAYATVLDIGVTSSNVNDHHAFINSTKVGNNTAKPLVFKYDSNHVMRLTDTCVDGNTALVNSYGARQMLKHWVRPSGCTSDPKGEVHMLSNVGIGVEDPIFPLDVEGNIFNTGEIFNLKGMETNGNVTANYFIGSGFYLKELQVSFMTPTLNADKNMLVAVNNNGEVGIGSITSNMQVYSNGGVDYLTADPKIDSAGMPYNAAKHMLYIGDDDDTPQLWLGRTINSGSGYSYYGTQPPYTVLHSKEKFDIQFNNYQTVGDKIFSVSSRGPDNGSLYTRGGTVGAHELVSISAAGDVVISGFAEDDHTAWTKPYNSEQLVSVNIYGMVNAKDYFGGGAGITGEQLDVAQVNHVTFNAQVTMKEALTLQETTNDYCRLAEHSGSLYHVKSGGVSVLCFCESANIPRNISYYTPQKQRPYNEFSSETSLVDYEVTVIFDTDGDSEPSTHYFYVSADNRTTSSSLTLQSVDSADAPVLTVEGPDQAGNYTMSIKVDEIPISAISTDTTILFKNPIYNSNYCR